jgi:hypothetical protein
MKKSKILHEFENNLYSSLGGIEKMIEDQIKGIREEYAQIIIEQKNNLLIKIADDMKLDVNELKKKYLKKKEIINISKSIALVQTNTNILDKIVIDDIIYYYECKENGKVYNQSSKQVGHYKENKICLSEIDV